MTKVIMTTRHANFNQDHNERTYFASFSIPKDVQNEPLNTADFEIGTLGRPNGLKKFADLVLQTLAVARQ